MYILYIVADAIEIFFVNSHQNGATSWIPRDLPPNVKIVLTFTTGLYMKKKKDRLTFFTFLFFADPESQTAEKSKFLSGFSKDVTEQYNILHLEELGAELAEKVLQYWMNKINRQLTNFQVEHSPELAQLPN